MANGNLALQYINYLSPVLYTLGYITKYIYVNVLAYLAQNITLTVSSNI